MSCHGTHGGVAVTGWARAHTDLDDGQVSSIYHRIKREAAAAAPPDAEEVQAWVNRMRRDVQVDPELSAKDAGRILTRLEKVEQALANGEVPDGATFAAWQRTPAEAASASVALDTTITAAARQQRINPDRLAAKFRHWRREDRFEDMESPDPDFIIPTDGLPSDKATARALRKLGFENYLAQRLPVFVYGTLRKGQGNAGRMDGAIESLTDGRVDGVAIYGPGRGFPYAQESPDGQGYTVGDLVHLTADRNGDQSRQSLDQLEGFNSDQFSASHYRRVTREVSYTDADGNPQTTKAWTYLAGAWAAESLSEDERIHDGDWVAAKRAYANERFAYARRRFGAEAAESAFSGSIRVTKPAVEPAMGRSARDSAAAFESLFASEEGDGYEVDADEHGGFLSVH